MVMTTTPTDASTYTSTSNLLFKKLYDGLSAPLSNSLKGTCHVGQLIADGVKQQTWNGESVRGSYVGGDEKLNIFAVEEATLSPIEGVGEKVYFRGDDQQVREKAGTKRKLQL